MNNLSWLIYLASVSGHIDTALWTVFALACFVFVIVMFISTINLCIDTDVYGKDSKESVKALGITGRMIKNGAGYYLPFILIVGLTASLLPDKTTLYLIAGSQFGQSVLENPANRDIMNAVHDKILNELKN